MTRPEAFSLSIVIPAFNESRTIAATLTEVIAFLSQRPWEWEIRLVDDGSVDDTVRIAETFQAKEPRVVVQTEPHRGKGGAVRSGLLAARGSHRFICDADLAMPIGQLERFLPDAVGGCDIAIGSREEFGARRIGEPAYRHIMGRLFNFMVQRLVLPRIEDSQCGFKMFTASAVAIVFPLVEVQGWGFDVEVLAIARARGLSIVEVPIEWHFGNKSQLSMLRDGPRMFADVWRIRRRMRRMGAAGGGR